MRFLWSAIVVCLVAVSGAGRAEARPEPQLDELAYREAGLAVAPGVASRSSLHPITARARAPERALPPAALATAFSLRAPSPRALDRPRTIHPHAVAAPICTGSARGPPAG
jgi:hypothetical protein